MKRIPTFLAGMLTMALIGSLGVGALAATGRMTINVDPVNIQVNGQTFKPVDAKGAEVPVFAYQGTTYAPLRALAEAYGLEVGYDAAANMATVKDADAAPSTPNTTAPSTDYSDWSKEEEAAYQEFKGMWIVECLGMDEFESKIAGRRERYYAYPSEKSPNALEYWEALSQETQDLYSYRWMTELKGNVGVILTLCKDKDSGAIYSFSIFEDGSFWPGHD